ncbi:MAG: hypothetical protein LBI60_03455 [Bacteroidales bacterium]|jgi:hypothetical protein|nr:hypothetical protein [Bacteroidales bacterium]
MKKYLITSILCVLIIFAFAQTDGDCVVVTAITKEIQEDTEKAIREATLESKITHTYYASRIDMDTKDFLMFANAIKKFGHKEGGDFDNWKKQNFNKAATGYYMFYTAADGRVSLYYEKLNERIAKQFQQYLPKGTITFDKNTYNNFFKDIDFTRNHWQTSGNIDARLKDIQTLAVVIGKILGITINPDKITYRQFETQKIAGTPDPRMTIPTKTPRNDGVAGFATWNDDLTSIEIDAGTLGNASISDAISTISEEVYHKYQMSEIEKIKQNKGVTEKAWDWYDSFRYNSEKNYGKTINDLQKEINKLPQNDKRREPLEQQRDAAFHSYYNLDHEKDAKEFAGKLAAMEYFVRNFRSSVGL